MMIRLVLVCAISLGAACAQAADFSIHAMLVNDRVLELAETTRLTRRADGEVVNAAISPNGKNIAYLVNVSGKTHLCLVKSTGGKATVVASSSDRLAPRTETGEAWEFPHYPSPYTVIAWSPDSKMLAIPAKRVALQEGSMSDRNLILVWQANGAFLTSLPLTGELQPWCPLVFSPDSRKIAFTNETYDEENIRPFVAVVDVQEGSSLIVYSQTGGSTRVEGWTSAESLLCWTEQGRGGQLRIVKLNGEPDTVVAEEEVYSLRSSDGLLKIVPLTAGIVIEDIKSGKRTQIVRDGASMFNCWVPNSRRLLYEKTEIISDDSKQRSKGLRTLWLADPDAGKINTMCVVLDHETFSRPTWSKDGTKMAYLCDGCLYVAELAWREPTAQEKIAAGLSLTEEEEKSVLLNAGKEIAVGLQMYWNDYDGYLPNPDTAAEDIKTYMSRADNYLRPGTDRIIFRYIPPSVQRGDDIEADTIIGELDPGCYSWKVVIYADSHVKTVPRD
ncbi:MAG: hypothetical protein A2Z18_03830 [Armatimonadetes bacterium RBG_16_58_9]|nr:MAG: hypothetical protein A2Z18_03830 [Armatimonadetes bacterium RBG_16_58_9]